MCAYALCHCENDIAGITCRLMSSIDPATAPLTGSMWRIIANNAGVETEALFSLLKLIWRRKGACATVPPLLRFRKSYSKNVILLRTLYNLISSCFQPRTTPKCCTCSLTKSATPSRTDKQLKTEVPLTHRISNLLGFYIWAFVL